MLDPDVGFLGRVQFLLLCFAQPFFYGAATRVPFIFAGIFARLEIGLSWIEVGLLIGTYQCTRAIANGIISYAGTAFGHFAGVAVGLAGYLMIAVADDVASKLPVFWVGISLVGFSEVITAMQDYAKQRYSCLGLHGLREKLRLQYAVNVAATAVGFGLGGVFYTYTGVRGVCSFGAALEGLELLSTSLFYYLATLERRSQLKGEGLGKGAEEDAGAVKKEGPHQQIDGAPKVASAIPSSPSGRVHSLFRPLSATQFVPLDLSRSRLSRGLPLRSSAAPNIVDAELTSPMGSRQISGSGGSLRPRFPPQGRLPTKSSLDAHHIGEESSVAAVAVDIYPVHSLLTLEDIESLHMSMAAISAFHIDVADVLREEDLQLVLPTAGLASTTEAAGKPPWINFVIAATFGIQALMIGIVLSTGPILLTINYGVQVAIIGYIFCAGEAIGFAALWYMYSTQHQKVIRKYFPGPFNILISIGALGVAAVLIIIPYEGVAVAMILLLMGLNDFSTSLTAEMQGGTVSHKHYRKINTLSNFLRRMGNTATAIVGPVLFGVSPQLPFYSFGVLTLVWIAILTVLFALRGRQAAAALRASAAAPEGEAVAPDDHGGGGGTDGSGDDAKANGLPQKNGGAGGILEGLAFYKNLSFISAEATLALIGHDTTVGGRNSQVGGEGRNDS